MPHLSHLRGYSLGTVSMLTILHNHPTHLVPKYSHYPERGPRPPAVAAPHLPYLLPGIPPALCPYAVSPCR